MMPCMDRDAYLAAIGQCIWYERIEPRTIEMGRERQERIDRGEGPGPNPFDGGSGASEPKPTAEEALRAFCEKVRSGQGSR